MTQLGNRNAAKRDANRRFYGWAILTVRDASQNGRLVEADPTLDNDYHANIVLPVVFGSDLLDDDAFQHA